MEKLLKREEIYAGKVIHVVKDEVELDDQTRSMREVVIHNGGVCIALKDEDGRFFMVRQYRYALGREMLEFPAGKIEKGEDPDEAIVREVEEETGYKAENIRKYGSIIPTCGYCTERIHLYRGDTGAFVGQHFDPDERIRTERHSLAEIRQMIKDGLIDDSKTIALMYHLENDDEDR